MTDTIPEYEVVLNEPKNRFELVVDGHTARINYVRLGPKTIVFTHTVVPMALKGQGIGNLMARHVLDYARENNLYVVPQCPFVRAYIGKHPEYEDLVQKSGK